MIYKNGIGNDFLTACTKTLIMDASKKILCPKIYPLNCDIKKRWFIRFFVKEGKVSVKKVVIIPKRLPTVESRLLWAKDYLKRLNTEGYTEKEKKQENTFNKHIKLLFEYLESKTKIKSKSRSQYLGHIRGFNLFCEQNNIQSINKNVAYQFINWLSNNHEGRTVNHYKRTLTEFYDELVKLGRVRSNPFAGIKRLPTKKAYSEHFTDKEISLITEGVKVHKPFLYLPTMVILHCATRNGQEMPNIKIKDIDFEGGKLWVRDTFSKNGESEAVFIPANLMIIFKRLGIDAAPAEHYLFTKTGSPGPVKVGSNYFQYHFRQLLEILGIYTPKKGFYRLKNSLAVKMVKKNVSKFAIQKQFRHKSFATTENYLSSLNVDEFPELREFSFF